MSYGPTLNLLSTDAIYCSSLVYQGYYYSTYQGMTAKFNLADDSDIIWPYSLPNYFDDGKEITLLYKTISGDWQ